MPLTPEQVAAMTKAGAAPTAKGPETPKQEKERLQCWERKNTACHKSAFVVFMLEKMQQAGCAVNVEKHFVCEECPVLGAFDAERNEIVLCQNNIISEREMADVMTHELIHAYDNCRGKVDFTDLKHLACTEIRAANLSGDCFMWKEMLNRLNFTQGFRGQHAACVKRKAGNSIVAVGGGDRAKADAAIDAVWDTCFNDTEPFDKIPF